MSSAATVHASPYEIRSLQHEQKMLEVYRRKAARDPSLLQPLANACRRAASFEWAVSADRHTVRRLWGEGARALAQGFARKSPGFDPSSDQFILAIHLSIAAREVESFAILARCAPGIRSTALNAARSFRGARGQAQLAESFGLVAHAILERKHDPTLAAIRSIQAALEQNDVDWWERRFPDPREATWLSAEHNATCELLRAIIHKAGGVQASSLRFSSPGRSGAIESKAVDSPVDAFIETMDALLLRLMWFVEGDVNHHPKLNVWLPGVALSILGVAAGLPVEWLKSRQQLQAPGYSRLPVDLILDWD